MSAQTQALNPDKLWEKIRGIEFAMLTTLDSNDGNLRSRPMATASKDLTDGNVWFYSKAESHKMNDVESKNKVNLTYVSPSPPTFISVCGTASIVRDSSIAQRLWSPMMEAYFSKGPQDPGLALIKVKIEKAEVWELKEGTMEYVEHAIQHNVGASSIHQQFEVGERPS